MIRYPNDKAPELKWRVYAALVTVATAIGSGYFIVMGFVDPGALLPGGHATAARTFGAYMAVRGAVLIGAAVWALCGRLWRALGLVLALNGAVQVLDTLIGAVRHQVTQAIGPACFAVALAVAAAALLRRTGPATGEPRRG